MSKPKEIILPEDHYMMYNGVKVHWFIGDYNFTGKYWEAWGSCNGKAYQMAGKYEGEHLPTGQKNPSSTPRRLYDITPLRRIKGQDYYFHQATYDLLTK